MFYLVLKVTSKIQDVRSKAFMPTSMLVTTIWGSLNYCPIFVV